MVLTLRCCNWTLLTLLQASRQDCEWNMQRSVWGHKSHVIFVRKAEHQVIPSTAPILELLSQVTFDGNVLAPTLLWGRSEFLRKRAQKPESCIPAEAVAIPHCLG